jgi:hypothetical protein
MASGGLFLMLAIRVFLLKKLNGAGKVICYTELGCPVCSRRPPIERRLVLLRGTGGWIRFCAASLAIFIIAAVALDKIK